MIDGAGKYASFNGVSSYARINSNLGMTNGTVKLKISTLEEK